MIRQLTAKQLHERLARDAKPPMILDVREPWECAICALPGATHIPMGQITARAAELPKDNEIVVLCHHGIRSQHVANYLQRLGFERIYNLQGGINAWSLEVDPAMPKY